LLNNLYLSTAEYYESSFIRIARIYTCPVLDKLKSIISVSDGNHVRALVKSTDQITSCVVICCLVIISIILYIVTDRAICTCCRSPQRMKTTILEFKCQL